jgi:hypothetical protein
MSRRRLLTAAGCVVAALLVASWLGAVAAAVASAVVLARLASPRRVILASVVLLAVTPIVWILGNHGRFGEVTFAVVTANRWPGRVAAVALVVLAVGVVWDLLASDDHEPAP